MSVGPMGMAGSFAGSVPQTKVAQTERAQHDTSEQSRSTQSAASAEQAAGVGETEEDQQVSDRDADGRRLWELPSEGEANDNADDHSDPPRRSKDPTGDRGQQIDFSG